MNHFSNVLDSSAVITNPPEELTIQTSEARIEYGLLIGDRWIHFFGEQLNKHSFGLSIDVFAGFGFGYRFYTKKYPDNEEYDKVFEDINDSNLLITPRVGFTIGIIF
jgi:hypothetical protein